MALLLAFLFCQAPAKEKSIDELISGWLKGDIYARTAIVKIGAPAIRPLLAVRDQSPDKIDLILKDLRERAAYPKMVKLDEHFGRPKGLSLIFGKRTDLHFLVKTFNEYGMPMFSDPFDSSRLKTIELRILKAFSPLDFLEQLRRQTGLEYGFFHNTIVIGLPERLWPGPPVGTPPPLDSAKLKRIQTLIDQLGDEDIQVRESAGKELLEAGAAVIPLLEDCRIRAEKEIAARCVAIIRALKKPSECAFGPAACFRQELSETDRELLKDLQDNKDDRSYTNVALQVILEDLLSFRDIKVELPDTLAQTKVSIRPWGQSILDVISLLTQSSDLDFIIRDRKIVIDTRERIEKLVPRSK